MLYSMLNHWNSVCFKCFKWQDELCFAMLYSAKCSALILTFTLLAFPHRCVTYDPNIVWLSAEIKYKYQLRFGFWWCRNHSLGVAFANPSNLSARPWDVLVWWVANCTARLHTHLASQPQDADQTVTWIKLSARPLDVLVWSVGSAQYSKHTHLASEPQDADNMVTIWWPNRSMN